LASQLCLGKHFRSPEDFVAVHLQHDVTGGTSPQIFKIKIHNYCIYRIFGQAAWPWWFDFRLETISGNYQVNIKIVPKVKRPYTH